MVMLSISFRHVDYLDSRRSIALDSIHWPVCENALQTESRFFVNCCIARDTLSKVLIQTSPPFLKQSALPTTPTYLQVLNSRRAAARNVAGITLVSYSEKAYT
ncbi:hypothetical protein Tco_1371681 [Tanacetum coccineum]